MATHPRSILSPQARTARWFCGTTLFLGPLGLVLGPMFARLANRRAARRHPAADQASKARSGGHYTFGQIFTMGLFAAYGLVGWVALAPWFVGVALRLAG